MRSGVECGTVPDTGQEDFTNCLLQIHEKSRTGPSAGVCLHVCVVELVPVPRRTREHPITYDEH